MLPPLLAHGLQGRVDLPIEIEVFYWASAIVLVVSFVALGVLWKQPRLGAYRVRPVEGLGRAVGNPVVVWGGRLVALALFALTLVAALTGRQEINRNIAPVMVFVVWWVGLVPLSVLFGNVWRALNPWATFARLVRLPEARDHSVTPRFGVWPAVAVMAAWIWLELAFPTASHIRLLGWLIVAYSVLTLAGMARYGIATWLDHGEAFSVYTRLLALLSPWEWRARTGSSGGQVLHLRPPFVGAVLQRRIPGKVVFVTLLIGSVSYDGLSRTVWWLTNSGTAVQRLSLRGVETDIARTLVGSIGLVALCVLAWLAFELASWAAARFGGMRGRGGTGRVAQHFAHSLLPIALAYNVAHYFSFFVFQSQDLVRLASDPLGRGWNLFGTNTFAIDYSLLTGDAIWLTQVGAIVIGHVVGLVLAHDRALELARDGGGHAVRSQWFMLALMVLYTVGGLYFLSEGLS